MQRSQCRPGCVPILHPRHWQSQTHPVPRAVPETAWPYPSDSLTCRLSRLTSAGAYSSLAATNRSAAMASDYTVGDLVAEFLTQCGVATAFGIASVHNIPMLDAI